MTIDVVATVSEPGRPDRPNEDGFGHAGACVWVIDGATGLGDEKLLDAPSDAAWLTAALDTALHRLVPGSAAAPKALLSEAAAEVEARFLRERRRAAREHYETPTAAVLLARFDTAGVEIAELGDCAMLLSAGNALVRLGGTEAGRKLERNSAARLKSPLGRGSPETMAYLRSVRNMANAPGGYAIFAPDSRCADAARVHRVAAAAGTALLMSDGYEAAIDYDLYSVATLLAAAADDVRAPLAALRAVEEADPDCARFPRFKPSDDATAVLLRFGADA